MISSSTTSSIEFCPYCGRHHFKQDQWIVNFLYLTKTSDQFIIKKIYIESTIINKSTSSVHD